MRFGENLKYDLNKMNNYEVITFYTCGDFEKINANWFENTKTRKGYSLKEMISLFNGCVYALV